MENRTEALLERLPEEIEGVLITSEVGRRYLTGMQSSAGTLLVLRGLGAYFIIDFRYFEKARAVCSGCEVILQDKLYRQIGELLKRHGVRRLAVESDYMTLAEYARWKERLTDVELFSDARAGEALRALRAVKSPRELTSIRAAQKITDDAFTHICGYIRAGMTDRQIAGELLDYTYRHGSERPAFDYIVVSGAHSSMPHGVPTDKAVEKGDFVTMDFGCVVDGYCSDMTRTVAVGAVSEEQRRVYDIVLQAQKAAIAAVRPGAVCGDVDAVARGVIAQAGYGGAFGHGTGHSLGLEIHETPAFAPENAHICAPGMVITVEPGIYLEGRFGVRTENMVLVTQDGCEDLTASDRNLLVL
ncbi:Xaa-Pro peptidase family protein [Anaerotruncus colihominis]|uniref:M24 family metallopeptidase n=1 Tax=Anaerotruncus colihominis TaxID=169435 RepID=UPI0026EA78D2|nr:aminopeptidase P family protein [Anaerotruncus colihominis]